MSSLVGFGTALVNHHRSVMSAMFAREFTGTDRETAKSQHGGHELEQHLKLHEGCPGAAEHGAVGIETPPFSAISSLAHLTCLQHEWERVE